MKRLFSRLLKTLVKHSTIKRNSQRNLADSVMFIQTMILLNRATGFDHKSTIKICFLAEAQRAQRKMNKTILFVLVAT